MIVSARASLISCFTRREERAIIGFISIRMRSYLRDNSAAKAITIMVCRQFMGRLMPCKARIIVSLISMSSRLTSISAS